MCCLLDGQRTPLETRSTPPAIQRPPLLPTWSINGDTTVYAAWGVDTNGDGVPDVNETGKYR